MRRKYTDCQRQDSNCTLCSLVKYGRDCHNRLISNLEWARLSAGMTRAQLSVASGVNARQIQRIEWGESDISNLTAHNLFALADALNIDARNLL